MAELTGVGDLVRLLFWAYWALAAAALLLALVRPKAARSKILWTLIVAAVFGYLPLHLSVEGGKAKESRDAREALFERAKAHFEMRCQSAGEKIIRTVDDVDGVLMLKVRSKDVDFSDQFGMEDPYGRNCSGGDDCIAAYLFDYKMVRSSYPGSTSLEPIQPRLYMYVDVVDEETGQRYRYTKNSANSPLVKNLANGDYPRYGVLWSDISTKDDRNYWIAGGALKIVDLKNNEVIAERRGYLMDTGQGDTGGFRAPWAWARSKGLTCPSVRDHNQDFASRVVKVHGGK
jgi:hypothetical protein